MYLLFLYKGLVLGFSVAAPVGPIGILCMNRTLNKSFVSGFISGMGAATADLIYGVIAGLGLTLISNFLIEQKLWIQIIGLIFLFYIGIKNLLKKDSAIEFNSITDKGLMKDYLSTFILTLTNPITILFFIAVFAGLGLSNAGNDKYAAMFLIFGVFMGSSIWWLLLCGLTFKLKNKIGRKILKRIDLISGILILMFGLFIFLDMIKGIK